MTKLTYTNDQQIINDAAQMLIENHLKWTNSGAELPSRDLDYVRGQMFDAYRKAKFDLREWLDMDDADRLFWDAEETALFKQAAKIADRKWQAAMTLLGIEQ